MCERVKAKNDRCNVRPPRNRQSTPLWFSFRQRRDSESSLTRPLWKGLRVYGWTAQLGIKPVLSTEDLLIPNQLFYFHIPKYMLCCAMSASGRVLQKLHQVFTWRLSASKSML